MSLFDFHYVSNEAEKIRFEEQQKSIRSALKELSNVQLQKPQEPLHLSHHFLSSNQSNQPYDPLVQHSSYQYTHNYDLSRERTPSMVSYSSSTSDQSVLSSQQDDVYNLSERDEYGFKRSLWIKPIKWFQFEQKYKKSKEKQSKVWNKLFINHDQQWPDLCQQLHRYVQRGIPSNIRAKVWMHYSGAQKKMDAHKGLYASLSTQSDQIENFDSIEKDLNRLFPNNLYLYDRHHPQTKLPKLRRVLVAVLNFCTPEGHRSIALLAGFLTLVVKDEEQVFWLLVTLLEDIFPANYFDAVNEGAHTEQMVLMHTLYDALPGIWSKIANKKCFWDYEKKDQLLSITQLTEYWFSTAFVNTLPVETTLRMWDCLFAGSGFKIVHQVTLTLLKLNEKRISNVEDPIEVLQVLQNMPKQLIDCDEFMNCVLSSNNEGIFDITSKDIKSKRTLLKNRRFQREMNQSRV